MLSPEPIERIDEIAGMVFKVKDELEGATEDLILLNHLTRAARYLAEIYNEFCYLQEFDKI